MKRKALTVEQMLALGYTLHAITAEIRRRVFLRVLREERMLGGERGAKGRAAARLGMHRNSAIRLVSRRHEVRA